MNHLHAPREVFTFLDWPRDLEDSFLAAVRSFYPGSFPEQLPFLHVVCARNLSHTGLRVLAKQQAPLLLLGVLDSGITLGPLQIRQTSTCLACLRYWVITADEIDRTRLSSPSSDGVALAARVAMEAIVEFGNKGTIEGLENHLVTINPNGTKGGYHPVVPRRDCLNCATIQPVEPINLEVHCSSLTGLVKRLQYTEEPVAGLFHATAAFMSPLLATKGHRDFLGMGHAFGYGSSLQQAKDSCLGEVVERYSVVHRGTEKLVQSPVKQIAGIDPRNILMYSDTQYEQRDELNRTADEQAFVPQRFDPDRSIDWLPGTDLVTAKQVWVPAACCLTSYQFRENEPQFAKVGTVGCAAGRTTSDALACALLEMIERDATAIWWHNRIRRPEVNLDSFEHEGLLKLRTAHRQIGRRLFLLDVTSDVGVPAYVSVSVANNGREPLLASAAHPCPSVAAWKAASEVTQIWFYLPSRDRINAWLSAASFETEPYLQPASTIDAPSPVAMTTEEQVEFCIKRLSALGLHPVAVNLSRPDVVLKTFRIIVPGMRHPGNQKGPGRLYNVPVQMGWRGVALREEEIGPCPPF